MKVLAEVEVGSQWGPACVLFYHMLSPEQADLNPAHPALGSRGLLAGACLVFIF